jgi:hypothetical protein
MRVALYLRVSTAEQSRTINAASLSKLAKGMGGTLPWSSKMQGSAAPRARTQGQHSLRSLRPSLEGNSILSPHGLSIASGAA